MADHRWRSIRLRTGSLAADPRLRERLVEEAIQKRSSMTAVALGILANAYGVSYEGTGRVGRATSNSDILLLSIPTALDRVIAVNAAAHDRTVQAEILTTLSAHYGLGMTRLRRSRAAA